MSNPRWDRTWEVFHAALERDGDERLAFLDRECQGDAALRREVDELLASSGRAMGFLEQPPPLASVTPPPPSAPASSLVGKTIGRYSIESVLGAGGMGVVYLARDTRLARTVAIKALAATFPTADELARFAREAQSLATLSHPNVATVFGLEEEEGATYLVMEHVHGASLAERLAKGPLPIEESLSIAAQIAAGVEAAHDAGVIHRDLKPSNVRVTEAGKVKVLDFGLARRVGGGKGSSSPTVTRVGLVVGTPGYMSPEQARGHALDRRTDVFSFGCILFACLTGKDAFTGDTAADALASVLERDPDWSMLPPRTPPRIRELLVRCLEKDRNDRLRDIGDARIDLEKSLRNREWTTAAMQAAASSVGVRSRRIPWTIAGAACALAGVAIVVALKTSRGGSSAAPEFADRLRLSVAVPESIRPLGWMPFQLTDDDRSLVWIGRAASDVSEAEKGTANRLYVRPLDSFESRAITGSDGVQTFSISPDGRSVLMVTRAVRGGASVKRAFLDAGSAQPVTMLDRMDHADWAPDGSYLVSTYHADDGGETLWRVSADGSEKRPLLDVRPEGGGTVWMSVKRIPRPDVVLLYTRIADAQRSREQIEILTLADGSRRPLITDADSPCWVAPGYIAFARGMSILAAPFDLDSLAITGEPVTVLGSVLPQSFGRTVHNRPFDVSPMGTLVYRADERTARSQQDLISIDRDGRVTRLTMQVRTAASSGIAVSPDSGTIALATRDEGGSAALALLDVRKNVLRPTADRSRPMTFYEGGPVWYPDSKRLIYYQTATAPKFVTRILRRTIGDGASPEVLYEPADSDTFVGVSSIAPDGKSALAIVTDREFVRCDVDVVSLDETVTLRPLIATPARERDPVFSPDGRWIALTSDATGRDEIYLMAYPPASSPPSLIPVSRDGGHRPIWSADGRELFFTDGKGDFEMVAFDPASASDPMNPGKLFDASLLSGETIEGVSRDGSTFYYTQSDRPSGPVEFRIAFDWIRDIRDAFSRARPSTTR
ncbi:MAG: serine/threonine-protein kinase [Planctomycetes bacterium]|nr:serine/threonine-protein kinase [Planctomycetota bacterium]